MKNADLLQIVMEHKEGAEERLLNAPHVEPDQFQYVRGMAAGLAALFDEIDGCLSLQRDVRWARKYLKQHQKEVLEPQMDADERRKMKGNYENSKGMGK